jgi:ADP-ribose pyrophosphatase YjhB (NUDIX family)
MRTNFRVTGVVIQDGRLLLIHRFKHGQEYYVFPGGGVEEGESWEDALKREMLEETGLGLVSYRYLYEAGETPRCVFYACSLAPGEPVLGGPELEDQTPDNRYILEWVALERIEALPNLYPRTDRTMLPY